MKAFSLGIVAAYFLLFYGMTLGAESSKNIQHKEQIV
jgi:hypothetical protein